MFKSVDDGVLFFGRLIRPYQTIYAQCSSTDNFIRDGLDLCRTIKANNNDVAVCVPYKTMKTMGQEENNISLPEELEDVNYRIRKLTEREVFRLMGVADKDIDKIDAAPISRSNKYMIAGNSIVVDVLAFILDKMLIHTDQDKTRYKQLSLF